MTHTPDSACVWFEIPVTDMDKAERFYAAVTGAEMKREEGGPNPMSAFSYAKGTGGQIYPGTPAGSGQGPTVHIAVEGTAEEAAERCTTAGGRVRGPVIEIPPGRFVYATDPDGNSIGLFQSR